MFVFRDVWNPHACSRMFTHVQRGNKSKVEL